MAIEGQVRIKCDAKVLDESLMLLGNLEIRCLTPNRTTLVKVGETCLTKTQPCCTSHKFCCTGDAVVFATAGL